MSYSPCFTSNDDRAFSFKFLFPSPLFSFSDTSFEIPSLLVGFRLGCIVLADHLVYSFFCCHSISSFPYTFIISRFANNMHKNRQSDHISFIKSSANYCIFYHEIFRLSIDFRTFVLFVIRTNFHTVKSGCNSPTNGYRSRFTLALFIFV